MAEGASRALEQGVAALLGHRAPFVALAGQRASAWFVAGIVQEAEQRRLFPWLAVAFGTGILVCFTATDGVPSRWAPLTAATLVAATIPLLRARPVALALVLALAAFFLGFAAAAIRLVTVASPVLARTTVAPLTGIVEALDDREKGARLILRVTSFGTLEPAARPTRVRVSYKAALPIEPGDTVLAMARLLPPPEAVRPGGYDFARDAFFRGIGAVGSLVGKIEFDTSEKPLPWSLRLAAAIDDARNTLTRRIVDANGGQAGAVAAALVTGKRGLISPETDDVLRAAGIYHVISISGLHMVLAAAVVFSLVRALLALVPALALAWPIKKIAAGFAMLGVTAYCAFSGWDVAAERALIMTLVMLGAILVDRPALSMRNLAIAALIALAREPEALLGPSFQMSFGAVAGLIACAPLLSKTLMRAEGVGHGGRALAWAATAVLATLATTLIAQIATAPFATYHFQTLQPFGLLGNALTLPLVSLAVMPCAVLGTLAYPFALDQPIWWVMGEAVRGMLAISAWIGGFSQSSVVVPAFGPSALLVLAAGLLIATLPVSRLRWLALAPACIGLALAAAPERADVFVDRDGAGAAVRAADGKLVALGRPPDFVMEQWLKADGDARKPAEVAAVASGRCDRLGCTVQASDGRWLALVNDKRAFAEDCARADILVSRRDAPPGCEALVVIDRRHLAEHGATAIRLKPGWPSIATVREPGRSPPWRAILAARAPRAEAPVEGAFGDQSSTPTAPDAEPGPAVSEAPTEPLQ